VNGGNATLTLPILTDTLVGRLSADTLTNKTIDATGTGNVITNIASPELAAAATIDDAEVGVSFIVKLTVTSGDLTDSFTVPAGRTLEVMDAWAVKFDGAGGGADTVQLSNSGAGAITDAMSLNIGDKLMVRAAEIDDVSYQVAAAASLTATGVEGTTDVDSYVYALCMWT